MSSNHSRKSKASASSRKLKAVTPKLKALEGGGLGTAPQDAVLLVGKHLSCASEIEMLLQHAAHACTLVQDYTAALMELNRKRFGALICHVQLGEEETLAFLSHLRDDPKFLTLPVIVVVPDDQELAIDPLIAGADTICEEAQLAKDLPRQLGILLDW